MQMLTTLSVGEVKTVYVRCDEQQRGATPKAAQTRIEAREHWHRATLFTASGWLKTRHEDAPRR